MGLFMKKIVWILMLCAWTMPVWADVLIPSKTTWYIVDGNILGANALDIDGVQSRGTTKRTMMAHYFANPVVLTIPATKTSPIEQKKVDFYTSIVDFNCSLPGVYKKRSTAYYKLGNDSSPEYLLEPLSSAQWENSNKNNEMMRIWNIICKNYKDNLIVDTSLLTHKKVMINHEDVLSEIRRQIQAYKK